MHASGQYWPFAFISNKYFQQFGELLFALHRRSRDVRRTGSCRRSV